MKFSYMVVGNEVKGTNVTGLIGEYETLFKLLSEEGYTGVEILIKDPFKTDFKEVERCVKKYNLKLTVICTGEMYGEDGLSFGDKRFEIRKEAIKRTKEAMKIAEYFGAHVNVGRLRGRFEEGVNQLDTIKWAKEGFLECALSNKNVNLLLEPINHKVSNFILNTKEGIEFIKELNMSNIRLMLDYIHMVIENEDISESVKMARDYLDHVHVCDSNRLPLGMGNFDFEEFGKALNEIGYEGYISVEAFEKGDYRNNIKTAIAIMEKSFKKKDYI